MGIVNRDDALYWATGIDTSGLSGDAERFKRIFDDLQQDAGVNVGKMKAALDESINSQKQSISKLESELQTLEVAYKKTFGGLLGNMSQEMIDQRNAEKEAISRVKFELVEEKKELEAREQAMEILNKKAATTITLMRNLRNEMARMRSQGLENTEQYKDMTEQLKKLSVVNRQVREEQLQMLKGGTFAGLMNGLTGLAGVVSAGAGVMGLMNSKSEDYAKIQKTLQSMIAITIGLQQTYNMLLPTSAFRIGVVTKATRLWDTATKNLTRSQLILRGVFTGGLFIAIILITNAISKLIAKQKEQREEAKKLNDMVANNAASQIANYERLRRSYSLLGDDMKAKEKWIIDNQTALKNLGTAISGVNDADNAFITNTESFKKSIMERAKSMAAMKLATEKYEEAMKKQALADTMSDKTTKLDSAEGTGREYQVDNKKKIKLLNDAKKLQTQAEAFITMSISADDKNADELLKAGLKSADKIDLGTKAHWESVKKYYQEKLDAMQATEKGSKDWNDTVKKINQATEKLKIWDLSKEDKKESDFEKELLNQRGRLAKEELDLLKQKTEGKLALIEIEKNAAIAAINEEEEAAKKQAKKEGKAFDDSVFKQRRDVAAAAAAEQTEQVNKELAKQQTELYRQLEEVFLNSEEKKREAIKHTYQEMRDEAKKSLDSGDMTDETYKITITKIDAAELEEQKQRLLDAVEDLNQKQIDTNKRYDTLILDAKKQLNEAKTDEERESAERLIMLLEESREKALSTIQSQMLQETDEWKNLFLNLEYLTADQIDEIVKKIEDGIGNLQLDPADLKALTDQLERARDVSSELRNQNPFSGIVSSAEKYKIALKDLTKAQKDYNEAKKEGADDKTLTQLSVAVGKAKKDMKQAAADMASDLNNVKSVVDAIGGSLMSVFDSFGMMKDDSSKQMADSVMGIAGGALTAGTGIAKLAGGDPRGLIDLAKGLGDVIVGINGVSDASKQKSIEQLYKTIEQTDKQIDSLVDAYEDLERASKRAFSSAKADMIAEQAAINQKEIEAREKQNEAYRKMIEEEQSKKNADDTVIKGFEDAIKENENTIKELGNAIEDSKDAFIEAITGTDVMSAIDSFAQAYADAFTTGNDAAKSSADFIKDLMKKSLMEAMKNDLKEPVEEYMEAFASAMKDGEISDAEQKKLDAIKEKMDISVAGYQAQLEALGVDENRKGVTGELKQEMTEQTGSQLVGLWNMTAMDIRSIKELLFAKLAGGELITSSGADNTGEMLKSMQLIQLNTLRTADNTDNLIPTLLKLLIELEVIKRNTKPALSRG